MNPSNFASSRVGLRFTRSACAVVVASVPLFLAPSALAEPSASDRTTARALAAEGYSALSKKDYELAEDRFRRAEALVHAPSLVVDHARALVGLGRLAEAYERYDSARRETVPARAPAAWKRAVADAQREIKSIESKIAWVTINVKGPSEPAVTVDGREVPSLALGSPAPVDVGRRTIRVTAEGYLPKDAEVTLSAGERSETNIELELAPVAAPSAPPRKKIVKRVAAPEAAPQPGPSTLTYVALGVGGAGLAVGAVTGVLFLGERSKLKSACPTEQTCPPETRDDRSRFYFYSYTSGIGLLAGLAGAGAGVYLLLSKPKSEETKTASAVVPYVSLGGAGLEGRF